MESRFRYTEFWWIGRSFVAALIVALVSLAGTNLAQSIQTDPGHKEQLSIGSLRFSCPNHFNIEPQVAGGEFVYLRHDKYDLGLFLASPGVNVGQEYIRKHASVLSSYLHPNERGNYKWKRVDDYTKVSKFEVGGGKFQGYNGQQRVCLQYRELRVGAGIVLVGYIFELGGGDLAKPLFERNLAGDSMPGFYAQAHIIASITGEKYDEINKGLIVAPPPPKER